MQLKIGTIIKKLRMENHMTQDFLATALGVTPQAISRWESEGGYPDIELLPVMANLFSVSVDELVGYNKSEREKQLIEIKKEMERLSEVGTVGECIDYAKTALSKYPSDYEIMENLSVCLYLHWQETNDEALLWEAEKLALSVVERSAEENIRYDAIMLLIRIYADTCRPQKALEMANQLTPMKYCRESAKSAGVGDGKTKLYIQDEIDKLADSLGIAVRNLVLLKDTPDDNYPFVEMDSKIDMLNISNKIYSLVYGDNLMFYHNRLSFNHWLISTYQIEQGKEEDALASLEQMCIHAVAYDISFQNDHGKRYSSVLLDGLEYPEQSKDFCELNEHSDSYYMLNHLKDKRYDGIRGNKRFIAVIDSLNNYAR